MTTLTMSKIQRRRLRSTGKATFTGIDLPAGTRTKGRLVAKRNHLRIPVEIVAMPQVSKTQRRQGMNFRDVTVRRVP